MNHLVALILFLCAFVHFSAQASITGEQAFAKLKSLAGQWHGSIDQPESENKIDVEYRVTSNGTVVMEKLFAGAEHEMITLYYLEGKELALVHYCAIGNQPRMKLQTGSTAERLSFDFAGGSNVDPEKDTHMHSAVITWKSADEIKGEWVTWKKGARTGSHTFFLKRKS